MQLLVAFDKDRRLVVNRAFKIILCIKIVCFSHSNLFRLRLYPARQV